MLPSIDSIPHSTTTVIDGGGRYGMHPTWSSFGGDLLYLAFEPDPVEAARLRHPSGSANYRVIAAALAAQTGSRLLHLTNHRGYCSFLPPDPHSGWFSSYRPDEGQVEGTIPVQAYSVDDVARLAGNLSIDFLKLDTEGTEFEILQGAEQQLAQNILGIRTEVAFQPLYQGQKLFPDIHHILLGRHFLLLNLDYFGRGVPQSRLVGNPDLLAPDRERFGMLLASEAVYVRDYAWLQEQYRADQDRLTWATLKYASFCLVNHAPDCALAVLTNHLATQQTPFPPAVTDSALYRWLRSQCIQYLGRWRVNPTDPRWELGQSTCLQLFGVELHAGHKYWELIHSLARAA